MFSPDGKTMAYRAMKPARASRPTAAQIVLRDVATGAERELAADWDRSADACSGRRDGKTLYVTAGDVGQTRAVRHRRDERQGHGRSPAPATSRPST